MSAGQPDEFRLTEDHMAKLVLVLQTVWPLEEQFAQLGIIMESVLKDWPKPLVIRFLETLANRVVPVSAKQGRVLN